MIPSLMKAWRLQQPGGSLMLKDVPVPDVRPGSVLVRVEVSVLISYLKAYVHGELPFYNPPKGEFTIGTNGVGTVVAVGRDVSHIKPDERVLLSPHFIARDNVDDPAQILIGLTAGTGAGAEGVLANWPDGTLAHYALAPVEAVTPAVGLEHLDSARLAAVTRCIIPLGGLLRGRLAAGETLVVTGATGAYGAAAVLLGGAMGAARNVAAGRGRTALDAVVKAGGPRVVPVVLTGDSVADATALRVASNGGADMAFDMVGNAVDPQATLAALHSLKRAGRLVLMGSMTAPLPVPYTMMMLNSWEILGQFMYPRSGYGRLLELVRSGLLDLSPFQPRLYTLAELSDALDAAANAGAFEYVMMQP